MHILTARLNVETFSINKNVISVVSVRIKSHIILTKLGTVNVVSSIYHTKFGSIWKFIQRSEVIIEKYNHLIDHA